MVHVGPIHELDCVLGNSAYTRGFDLVHGTEKVSLIASLQNAEIFMQRLLCKKSSALLSCWAFHQQAADQLEGNRLGGAGEEGAGEGVVAMGVAWGN